MQTRIVSPAIVLLSLLCGCVPAGKGQFAPEAVWGKRGLSKGRLQKPRAMAIDAQDQLYIVDMTARIQVFSRTGEYLRGWRTPEWQNGKPSGLSFDHAGHLLVADTHYYRMLVYDRQGKMIEEKVIGGEMGHDPGQFGFVTDAVEDSHGNFYIAEYGEYDRIQKFSPQGEFILQWGGHGEEPGQFRRPQNLLVDDRDRIWVADACNHRIQVFDTQGHLEQLWGQPGSAPGQLFYPYDLTFDGKGHLYVCEFGNHRVQKFDLEGNSIACWGGEGRSPGQLFNPWALVCDSQGDIHVLDTNNHRVQRVRF
ncbi:MAG: hypothetical protein KDA42_02305 [Planctomycetales bacterium]|nr:hypothetical protein [Planctomycetales bacterium]